MQVLGDANSNSGVVMGMSANATNGQGTNRSVATINGTYAPIGGTTGTFRGLNIVNVINETSAAANTITMININPTLTSVKGVIYGVRSQLTTAPTGGGTSWNIYADGTAKNVLVAATAFGSTTAPTSFVSIAAGVTGNAQINLAPGVAPSSPVDGDIYYIDTNDKLMFFKNATASEIIATSSVNTVSPTSPNRTLTVMLGGTTFYIAAKTTND